MTIDFKEAARPTVWLIEGIVEFKGNESAFWYEYDERDGAENYQFHDGEPEGDFDIEDFMAQCKAKLTESFRIVQELDKPQSSTDKDLERNCQYIADQLRDPTEWRKEYLQDHKDEEGDDYGMDNIGGQEWLEDVLDIRYIVGQNGELISGQVLVAMGGPTIWVNFDENYVRGYWGGDEVSIPFTDNIGVEDALEGLYEATR